jgi:hypothetical protein
MTIITLDRLYFVFSYRVALTNAPPMQLGRRVCREAMDILDISLLSRGVGSEVIWVIFLVGFWCEDTCHTVSSAPRSDDLPLELGVWVDLSFFLGGAHDRLDAGPAPDWTTLSRQHYDSAA